MKKDKGDAGSETLASVKKEMAKPRVARSVREGAAKRRLRLRKERAAGPDEERIKAV